MKAKLLWEAYKDRLGKSDYSAMSLDLNTLLHSNFDLSCLDEPFTTDEIDAVIQNLPNDKSPGPDGFNTDFVKKRWPIIK